MKETEGGSMRTNDMSHCVCWLLRPLSNSLNSSCDGSQKNKDNIYNATPENLTVIIEIQHKDSRVEGKEALIVVQDRLLAGPSHWHWHQRGPWSVIDVLAEPHWRCMIPFSLKGTIAAAARVFLLDSRKPTWGLLYQMLKYRIFQCFYP